MAQSRVKGSIRGVVVDSTTKKALREAPVTLLHAKDSSLITFTITGGEGNFAFNNIPEGNYRVLITFLGYRNISKNITLDASSPHIDLGTMEMAQTTILLNEVVIEQERAPITLKNDTLEFNATSFKTRPNTQVEELLKKMPGIEISRDGTIKAQGQEVKRVLVDGKPFFGDDPKVATRNLPAEIIDKVQLYDQGSDQAEFSGFDDGTREKTINLTTKKDKRKGIFGQNNIGVGTSERYQARLNFNRFNNGQQLSIIGLGNNINQQGFTMQDMSSFGSGSGMSGGGGRGGDISGGEGGRGGGGGMMVNPGQGGGIGGGNNGNNNSITESWAGGINYRDSWSKKLDVTGSYFANHSNIITDQKSLRQNILPDTTFINDQTNTTRNQNTSNRLNLRLDYRPDSLTSIRFTPSLTFQNSTYTSAIFANTYTGSNEPLNQSSTFNNSVGNGVSGNSNLLFMRKFNKKGRSFSFNLNTLLNQQHTTGTTRSANEFFNAPDGQPPARNFDQRNEQQTARLNNTATFSYTEPLSLRQTLEFHYIFGRNGSRSDKEVNNYNEVSGVYDLFNEQLSNEFNNTFSTQRAGATLQNKRLKYTYSFGLDIQQAGLKNDNESRNTMLRRNFTNLLPNAMFTYSIGRNKNLRINYRSRINSPSVSQLQPVPDNSNPLNIRLGDPDLKPEYSNQLTATYNFFNSGNYRSLFAALNLNQTGNKIVNAQEFSNTGTQTTRPVNENGYYTATGFVAIGRPIRSIKANINLTTNLGYNRGISLVNGQENRSKSLLAGQGVSLNSNYNEKFEYGISANMNYQQATYSLQSQQNNSFFSQVLTADLYYELPYKFIFTSEVTYTANTGRSAGYNQSFVLWNAALARQLFKNKQGELKLQVYDILNQNRSIVRNIGDTYVEDVQSQVLQQYFMLSFTYHLRKFGGNFNMGQNPNRRSNMPPFMRQQGRQ
ncbi:TonB-dependent receptor [Rhodocytophaga rosea]|uniref:TonB-dependent receptor n=2 Tax=Rhodocytophaga rosea TaxID=2704465 RepID=A0A6C0GVI4_9BACT|nr:TonB-dependent receptor [Rhodocytophaga rosea]